MDCCNFFSVLFYSLSSRSLCSHSSLDGRWMARRSGFRRAFVRANRVAGNMRRSSLKGGGRDNRWTIRRRAGGERYRGRWRTGWRDKGSIPRVPLSGWDEFVARGGSFANLFASRLPRRRISRIRRPTWPRPGNQRSTSSGNGLPERPPSSLFHSRPSSSLAEEERVAERRRGWRRQGTAAGSPCFY